MILSGADILVQALVRHGVRVVFAYPGGTSMPIHQALTKVEDQLRTILPRHEQGGGFAASAYARFTGRVGVCIATSGPGATNFVPCLADAMRHAVPLLAITGQVHRAAIGTDAFQEIPIVAMCRSITKHHYQVGRGEDLARVVREACHLAATGRPGPVLIDVPKDVQIEQVAADFDTPMHLPGYRSEPTASAWFVPSSVCLGRPEAGPLSPHRVLRRLKWLLRQRGWLARAVLTTSCGPEQVWVAQSCRLPQLDHWLTTDSLGGTGYALPAALGVLAAEPDRPVIAVTTADNLLINIHELACAYCEKLPVKVLLLRQDGGGLDFVQICQGFGGAGQRRSAGDQLDDALAELLAAQGPYLLDVEVEESAAPSCPDAGFMHRPTVQAFAPAPG